jgi:hypothetical protein
VPINQNTDQRQQTGGSNGDTGGKESFQVSAPSISLPKGGGAIRGIGEKFATNPVTGTGSMTVPIATSPLTAAQVRQVAPEITWNPKLNPAPVPPWPLEEMYTGRLQRQHRKNRRTWTGGEIGVWL